MNGQLLKCNVCGRVYDESWATCNLGYQHFDHYEDTSATFCNRCERNLSK